jgi:predicted helicase
LIPKIQFLIKEFNASSGKSKSQRSLNIKWDRQLDKLSSSGKQLEFDEKKINSAQYRAFNRQSLYWSGDLNSYLFRNPFLFGKGANPCIMFRCVASEDACTTLACSELFDQGALKTGNGRTFGVARFRYTAKGERVDNVTDWALVQFRTHYGDLPGGAAISKDDIFAYVYAAMHDPVWRETYAADLRRYFPRIPFHADFMQWRDWGQRLLALHIDYESQPPHPDVARVDAGGKKAAKPVLRSDPDNGKIILDSETQLTEIPRTAWDYRLGNRSAIDWVLDQHKEKTPRDPTVAAKFNTYRFADHKEKVIDLLGRVVAISVETVAIVEAMRAAQAGSL